MTAHASGGRSRVALAMASSLAVGAMVVHVAGGIALLLPAMVGVLALFLLVRSVVTWPDAASDGNRRYLWWTILAFVSHLAFGLVVTNAGGVIGTYFRAPDSFAYHNIATEIVKHWEHGAALPYLPAGKEGFYYLLAALYWVFGPYTAAGLALNAAFAAALVPLVSDTTRRLFGEEAAARVPPLVVLLPGLFLWTSQLIKEAVILLLIALALNCAVRVVHRPAFASLTCMTVSLVLLFTFRGWVALVVAGGLVAAIAFGRRQLVAGFSTAVGALAIIVVILSFGVGYSGYQAAVSSDLAQANVVRRDLALSANTGYDHEADISTSQRALLYLPRGLVNFGLGPFPWQVASVRQLPVVPDMLVWWFLLPSLWRGLRESRRRVGRTLLVVVLPAVTTACLLALAVGNFGTAVRERAQVVVILVPVIALGLTLRRPPDTSDTAQPEPVPALVNRS
jgi:hypothetical protein